MDNTGLAAHLTRSNCEGFEEVLYIQRSELNWWRYVVEWQCRGWKC